MTTLPADPIFISYSRRDDETMRKIAFFLRDKGFKVWVDNEKLIPGTPAWEESIENAIKNAFAVIVILSPDSKNSEWVRREITYSDQFSKRVFPVLAKGTEDASLPIRLITRQYVDFRDDEEAGLNELMAAITFYIDQKKTLEMHRPATKRETVNTPIAASISSQPKSKKSPTVWILAGILITVCVVGLGGLWAGYRFFSPLIPITGATSVDAISTSSIPAEIPMEAPTEVVIDASANTPIPPNPNISAPEMLSQFLNDVQVTNSDTFDDPSGDGWDVQSGKIDNGVMEIIGNDNWDGAWRDHEFRAGEGILVDFSYSSGSTFTIHMDYGTSETDPYRRFGIYFDNGSPVVDVYEGKEYRWDESSGDLVFEPDKTYTLLIAILSNGEFLELVWEASNPASTFEYRKSFGTSYADSPWAFWIQSPKGRILFDNFHEIKFSGAN